MILWKYILCQCDQIEIFLKGLGDKLTYKSRPILGYFENHHTSDRSKFKYKIVLENTKIPFVSSKLREKFIWYKLYDGQLLENEAFLFPSSGHTEFGFLEHNGITHSSSSHAR